MAEAMELGRKAAELISAEFPNPIRLEFEKVSCFAVFHACKCKICALLVKLT